MKVVSLLTQDVTCHVIYHTQHGNNPMLEFVVDDIAH